MYFLRVTLIKVIVLCSIFRKIMKYLEILYRLWVFMPPKELWEAYSNRTVSPSILLSCPVHISYFFEVGIPNLVCGYILGWQSVAYHFRVTVTLTFDLVFRIIVSGAYLLYYLR